MKTFVPPVNLVLLYYICITIVLYCTYCYYMPMYHLLCDLSVNKNMLFCTMSERSYHGATSHSPTHWMRLSEEIDITRALQYECGNCNRKNVVVFVLFFCLFGVCFGFFTCSFVDSCRNQQNIPSSACLFVVCLLFVCCCFCCFLFFKFFIVV